MTVTRDGAPVGEVTSGTFSPTRRVGIGLALLAPDVAEGDELTGHAEHQGQRPGGRAGPLEQRGVVEERPAEPLGQQPTDRAHT
jgi:glycine cleavage system aminomethyltransferase T